ncbi:hypothetical protein ACP275_06G198600 [Erythranthe tilingii]
MSSSRTANLVFAVMVMFFMCVSFQPKTMTNAVQIIIKCNEAECKTLCENEYGSHLLKHYCNKTPFGDICTCEHTLLSGRKGKTTVETPMPLL